MKVSREYLRDGEPIAVSAERLGVEGSCERWRVRVGASTREYLAQALGDGGVRLAPVDEPGARSLVAHGAPSGKAYMVRVDGRTHTLASPAARRGGGGGGADGTIRAPMTGTVLDVLCQAGDEVQADQTLVVLSAMKMEHKLIAGIAGVVQSVSAEKDGTVEQGAVLVVVEPKPAPQELE
ncbi:MAG TPA: biotin/lipoyl-containing protein [Planctomycetota bacterium]|nr:biotin/lipoyl-containing protein [Planctomycetota bacterium]